MARRIAKALAAAALALAAQALSVAEELARADAQAHLWLGRRGAGGAAPGAPAASLAESLAGKGGENSARDVGENGTGDISEADNELAQTNGTEVLTEAPNDVVDKDVVDDDIFDWIDDPKNYELDIDLIMGNSEHKKDEEGVIKGDHEVEHEGNHDEEKNHKDVEEWSDEHLFDEEKGDDKSGRELAHEGDNAMGINGTEKEVAGEK